VKRKVLYLDLFSGAAGDMLLGALIDLGLPLEVLRAELGNGCTEYAIRET